MARIDVPPALRKLFARRGLVVFVAAAVILEALGLAQYFYARKAIEQESKRRAESELAIVRLQIEKVTESVEIAVRNSVWALEARISPKSDVMPFLRELVARNDEIADAAIGFVPDYHGHYWYEPLAARREDGVIEEMILGSESHDYFKAGWYTEAIRKQAGVWSEPYYDESGGKAMVVTYAFPVRDASGGTVGVLGADISLDWLSTLVSSIKLYPNAFSTVRSGSGTLIASPAETLSVAKTVRYDTPLNKTGWTLSIVLPEEEIYSSANRIGRGIALMQILALILLVFMIRSTALGVLRLEKVMDGKRKIENELHIASSIQMAMIPKVFPPFPERSDLDMSATLVPAKEVGGDLYDFFIRDEKLFFCIGDVSGKGVPASLVMAVTRSLFRTMSAHESSPAAIVTALNESMSEGNESNMFVTFFLGILDLRSGHLRYCNAGHNAPLIFKDKIWFLPVEANLPLAVMPGMHYKEQEADLVWDDALFLYTDGLTEAENQQHELFGEARMEKVLHGRRNAAGHLEAMKAAVKDFVQEAPQSDDLTMLFIHYLPEGGPETT